ncbi:hypothetical protein DIPPA_24452 [Diplonema papillatum]|nr:hypothetical protein DIPPA_24452 [Diplonema papillatum]
MSGVSQEGHIVCTKCLAKCADQASGLVGYSTMWYYCPACQQRTWWKKILRKDACPNSKCWYKQYNGWPRWGDKTRAARQVQKERELLP